MGTVALTIVSQGNSGNFRAVVADVVFSASYATGGDTVPMNNLPIREVDQIVVYGGTVAKGTGRAGEGFTPNTHGIQPVLTGTPTAPLLKAVAGAAGTPAEVTNATNLSAVPAVRVEFRGA